MLFLIHLATGLQAGFGKGSTIGEHVKDGGAKRPTETYRHVHQGSKCSRRPIFVQFGNEVIAILATIYSALACINEGQRLG